MPTSRKTRQTSSVKAASSLVVLDEATKKKCHSIIEDFDRQVLSRLETSRSKMESIYSQIRTKTNLLILQTPKEIQGMKLTDFESLLQESPASNGVTNSSSGGGILLPPPETAGTLRKSRRTKKTSVNTSSKSTRSFVTPAVGTRTSKRAVPTPMTIKTKFNIGTPLTKSICRLAKPDEPLISMSGSPVMLSGSQTAESISEVMKDLEGIPKDKLLSIQSKISLALEQKK